MVQHRRAGEREPKPVGSDGLRQAADGLCALRVRVLAVVRFVDHERAQLPAREGRAMGGEYLVVEDRDLAGRWDRSPSVHDRDRAVRQPSPRLALPPQLHRRWADDDRRVGAIRLERRQCLDRLSESLFVGQERAAGLQRVTDGGPLKRRELTAEDGGDRGDRLSRVRARPPDRVRGLPVLGQQPLECLCRQRSDLDPVARDERVEVLRQPGIERGAVSGHAREPLERIADRRVPQDLE